MWLIELARTGAQLAPGVDQLAVFRKFQNAVISGAVSLRYEDDAVGRNQNIIRLVEIVGLCRAARFAERHQKFSFGTEFVDLIPLRCSRAGANRPGTTRSFASRTFTTRGLRRVVLAVGNPYVALTIHEDAVRENQHPFTKTLHQLSGRIKLENRSERRHLACCAIQAAILPAPLGYPNGFPVFVDLDRAR